MEELLIASRAAHFGSSLVLLAVFAVRLLVERPAAEYRGRGLAAVCLAIAMVSGFLWLWVAIAGMNGSGLMDALNPQLFQLVLEQTPPGQVWVVRSAAALLVAVALCLPRGKWAWGVLPGVVFVGSIAWLGHACAGEGERRWIMLGADTGHLLAAGLWPAGLLPFALLLRRRMKAGELAAAHMAARRFSAMSLTAVAVLAGCGLVNAWFLVGGFRGLVTTDYGRLLMVKLALFAGAVCLGACNLLIHKPRLESEPGALGSMARKVWVEVGLGTLIVAVVAIMGTLPPAGLQ